MKRRYIIYGSDTTGCRISEILTILGHQIQCFIDKTGKINSPICKKGIPVFSSVKAVTGEMWEKVDTILVAVGDKETCKEIEAELNSTLGIKYKIKNTFSYPYNHYIIISNNLRPASFYNYLEQMGWIDSVEKREALDANGNPIPWMPYSFIDFLEERLVRKINVFEYGSGNSTFWLAKKSNRVISVEHNKEWYDKMENYVPKNVTYLFSELKGSRYEREILAFRNQIDLVIIDGRKRNECIVNAIQSLTPRGVIVVDDTMRDKYKKGINYLLERGFKNISFSGLGPVNGLYQKTTLFYKANNIFGI